MKQLEKWQNLGKSNDKTMIKACIPVRGLDWLCACAYAPCASQTVSKPLPYDLLKGVLPKRDDMPAAMTRRAAGASTGKRGDANDIFNRFKFLKIGISPEEFEKERDVEEIKNIFGKAGLLTLPCDDKQVLEIIAKLSSAVLCVVSIGRWHAGTHMWAQRIGWKSHN